MELSEKEKENGSCHLSGDKWGWELEGSCVCVGEYGDSQLELGVMGKPSVV